MIPQDIVLSPLHQSIFWLIWVDVGVMTMLLLKPNLYRAFWRLVASIISFTTLIRGVIQNFAEKCSHFVQLNHFTSKLSGYIEKSLVS